ncbi:MAG TPA: vitamin K epoxide reductase family protein [Candidatus Paceibacterota bacterium]|jgi:uncharacterized membrane protein
MSRRVLLVSILVLSFLGLADSWYLAQSALTDTALTCGIESLNGCNTVAQSEYSNLFGVPLALYGVAFYAIIFIAAAFLLTNTRAWLVRLLFLATVVGFLASLYFLYLQVFLIKALCIYCLASFVFSVLLFLAAWRFKARETLTSSVVP